MKPLTRQFSRACAAVAVAGLAACAGQASSSDSGLRGVGTPDVSSYPGDDQITSVQELLDRCRQAPEQAGPSSAPRGLEAACGQLYRTMHNQPGNTEQPAGP